MTKLDEAQVRVDEWRGRIADLEQQHEATTAQITAGQSAVATAMAGGRDAEMLLPPVMVAEALARSLPAAIAQAKQHLADAEAALKVEQAAIARIEVAERAERAQAHIVEHIRGLWAALDALLAYREEQRGIGRLSTLNGLEPDPSMRYGFGPVAMDLYMALSDAAIKWPQLYAEAGAPSPREIDARL